MLNFVTPNKQNVIASGTVTQIKPQVMRIDNVNRHVFAECDSVIEFLLWVRKCLFLGGVRILDQYDDSYAESVCVNSVETDMPTITANDGNIIYAQCEITEIDGSKYFTAVRTYA